jgi:AraC-like DNA-binding protein
MARSRIRQDHERLFQQAARLIEQALGDRDLSLVAVARELAISPRQLQRVFAEVAGESFSDYLLRRRMERARILIEEQGVSARQAAPRVGYGSGPALMKARRRTGTTGVPELTLAESANADAARGTTSRGVRRTRRRARSLLPAP